MNAIIVDDERLARKESEAHISSPLQIFRNCVSIGQVENTVS